IPVCALSLSLSLIMLPQRDQLPSTRHEYHTSGNPWVQPLSVVDNSDFSPTGLTFPLDSPSSSFSEGNGPSSSFQAKSMLHEHTCVSTRVLSHLLVFRCLVPFSGPILVLSSREQQPGCAR